MQHTARESLTTLAEPEYRFGDQRPDGMYYWGRRSKRLLTNLWLTGPAFRNANGGKFPNRTGRLRYDGKRLLRGFWVSQEDFDRPAKPEKVKLIRPGTRKPGDKGSVRVFAGYRQGTTEVWWSEEAWIARRNKAKAAKAARNRRNRAVRKPKVCGQFVKPGLMFVREFSPRAGGRATRVYFNCAQWKAALEGQEPPPPELKRVRLRAYLWLLNKLRKQNAK